MHHYLSIVLSGMMLLWRGPLFDSFASQFVLFCVVQGIVQILINRYQLGRLYKEVAMGKAGLMDVTGESVGWTPSAMTLLPFLVVVQSFQLINCYALLKAFVLNYQCDEALWLLVSGLIFGTLGFGNLSTTFATYYSKFRTTKTK
jgi:hypothetical protein